MTETDREFKEIATEKKYYKDPFLDEIIVRTNTET